MGTFDDCTVGEVFASPSRGIDDSTVETLVHAGGYVHPLFADPGFARASAFGRSPLPGAALLLIMGGLAEQTNRFDESVIALLGFDDVRFLAPAFGGDTLRLEVEVVAKDEPKPERGLLVMAWRCRNAEDVVVAQATARMLFRVDPR